MKRVGFIGLGAMGYHMAKNISQAGYDINVFDINPLPMSELEQLGAIKTEHPKEVGEKSELVFLMVQNYQQCKGILEGENGLLEGMEKGVIVITSTISPDEVQAIEEKCKEKQVDVLDSPVSGGVAGSKSGKLTLMVAGREELYEEALPELKVIGSNIIKVGNEIGMGQSIKAVNQYLVSVHLVAMSEALTMGVKSGLDPEMIYKVIKDSAGNSKMFEEKVPGIIERDFSPKGLLNLLKKDLDICIQITTNESLPFLLGTQCKEIFKLADTKNLGEEDISSLIKVYEDLSRITVESKKSNLNVSS